MIEVNLLPGGRKRSKKGSRFSLPLPSLGGLRGISMPSGDRWTLGAAAAVILVLAASAWFYFSVNEQTEELQVQLEAAQGDSIRFSDIIRRSAGLQARRDTIAQRVSIIQEIDGARYLWPHMFDEVGRALTDYLWLTRFAQLEEGENVLVQLEGRTGNYLALVTFIENLEASPYVQNVELVSSEQTEEESASGVVQLVYMFVVEARSSDPPPEIVETVPLFSMESAPVTGGN